MTFAIYFGMLGLVCLLVLRRPSVALGAFLCTYGLEQWAQSRDSFFFVNAALTNVATASVLIWALVVRRFRVQGGLGGGFSSVFWIIAALFLWSIVSLLWTPDRPEAIAIWRSRLPYIAATVLLMPLVARDMDDLKAGFQMTLLLGAAVLLLLTFDSAWTGRHIQLRQGAAIGSIVSDRGNPLATASLAGWVGLIALLMNFRGAGRFWQMARWPLVLLGLIVAFRAGSRGQLFAMVAAGIMFLPFSRRIRNIWGFVGTAAGVVLTLTLATWAFDIYAFGAATRWNTDNMINTWRASRFETSRVVLEEWFDAGPIYWVIGLGTSASYDIIGFYPHLVMAEVLAEHGLIGFVLLWLVVIYGYKAYAKIHAAFRDDPVARGTAAALAALFMFEIILSFKQGSMLGSVFAFGFAVLLGRLGRQTLVASPSPYGQMLPGESWGTYAFDPDPEPDARLRPGVGGL